MRLAASDRQLFFSSEAEWAVLEARLIKMSLLVPFVDKEVVTSEDAWE